MSGQIPEELNISSDPAVQRRIDEEKEIEKDVAVSTGEPKPPYKEGQEWLSEIIDTSTMYRVKGWQGLYTPRTLPSKSGIVKMVRFMSDETHWVSKKELQGLASAVIYKTILTDANGKKIRVAITLSEALDNLQEHFDSQPTGELSTAQKQDIMEIICPDYDETAFKDYHAKKIVQWYNEIITAINKAS